MSTSWITRLKALPHTTFKALSTLRRFFDSKPEGVRTALSFSVAVLFTLSLAAGHALFAPSPSGPYGPYVCLPISLKTLSAKDFPHGLDTRFPEGGAWVATKHPAVSVSLDGGALVRGETLSVGPEDQHYGLAEFMPPSRRRGLVNFTQGLVSIETVDGSMPLALLRHSPIPNMADTPDLFQSDMFTPADYMDGDIPPLLYGEETDENGRPLRWSRPRYVLPGLMACDLNGGRYTSELYRVLRSSRFAPQANYSERASRYHAIARRYAEKYNLAFPLMLAIMHTESNFNPYAVSRSQAIGLMQIIPETAGNEVYRYLTGLPGQPNPEVLFSPEYNIRYGAIYLHLLSRRHFGNVVNPRSRQICVIAAYNGGPGAVLRLFDSDRDAAVARINSLSPDDVYKTLTTDMPHAENRRYVELVLGRMQAYSAYY